MSDTIILAGPDGRFYEIPSDVLARYLVPGHRVNEVRQRLAPAAPAAPAGHLRPGDPLPPGVPPPPGPSHAPSATTTIATPAGGTVVLNFYFGAPAAAPPAAEVEGYHLTFDANGIPTNHVELLWGDYVDRQGNPAVGWHSHDPVTGNAQ
jgi:hypothetical protein